MKLRKMVMMAGGTLAGAVLARRVARVVRRVIRPQTIHGHSALIGRECVLTTLSVDEHFGQARCEDGGPGLILSVRCTMDNDLTYGRVARIVAYHEGSNTYDVEPL